MCRAAFVNRSKKTMTLKTYDKQNPQTIQSLFGSIAQQYDKTNAALSFRMHNRWNAELVRCVTKEDTPVSLLDLCCGTGEIAFTFMKQTQTANRIYLLDFCEEMLECAKNKAQQLEDHQHTLTYLKADAQEIPLPAESVSCATIAYGIRNVKEPRRCLEDVYRVLEPGGTFGILELTQPCNKMLRFGHKVYLRHVLPRIGRLLTRNEAAYRYLCQSIQHFVDPVELEQTMQEVGFINTYRKPLTQGIATVLLGRKPLQD